mmetsp:Transcript_29396/g.41635  ORF Transcript_29396/g.41635 Transcript_29396/m.41635 type:complete len:442 (+) Transcript_29396:403-1728(+)
MTPNSAPNAVTIDATKPSVAEKPAPELNQEASDTNATATTAETKDTVSEQYPTSPPTHSQIYNPPQQGAYYFEPPSPGWGLFGAVPQYPPSPAGRGASQGPPASPLFPRSATKQPASPFNFGAVPQGYGSYTNPLSSNSMDNSPPQLVQDENGTVWGERPVQQQLPFPQMSPQLSYGRPTIAARSNSFDQPPMLPPPDPAAYSPANTAVPVFAAPWGYPSGPPDMYSHQAPPQSPHRPPHPNAPPPYYNPYAGQYYPATSPGPPIQTTASNKGPDGANLFIFHIPNHFTNMDMYRLFCQYGSLLSVRIMVERDTGRSRGFGFVSYDSPESAALAIKELNGFAIGNKRLKVQHKQIRSGDQQRAFNNGGVGGPPPVQPHDHPQQPPLYPGNDQHFLPPPANGSNPWYEHHPPAPPGEAQEPSPLTASLDPLRNALPDIGTVE